LKVIGFMIEILTGIKCFRTKDVFCNATFSVKIAVFRLLIIALMMETARTSETLVNFYQTTRCYNPEDSNRHTHRRENLKSYLTFSVFVFGELKKGVVPYLKLVFETEINHDKPLDCTLIKIGFWCDYRTSTSEMFCRWNNLLCYVLLRKVIGQNEIVVM
jgi:hypothetical protein